MLYDAFFLGGILIMFIMQEKNHEKKMKSQSKQFKQKSNHEIDIKPKISNKMKTE